MKRPFIYATLAIVYTLVGSGIERWIMQVMNAQNYEIYDWQMNLMTLFLPAFGVSYVLALIAGSFSSMVMQYHQEISLGANAVIGFLAGLSHKKYHELTYAQTSVSTSLPQATSHHPFIVIIELVYLLCTFLFISACTGFLFAVRPGAEYIVGAFGAASMAFLFPVMLLDQKRAATVQPLTSRNRIVHIIFFVVSILPVTALYGFMALNPTSGDIGGAMLLYGLFGLTLCIDAIAASIWTVRYGLHQMYPQLCLAIILIGSMMGYTSTF